MTTSATQTVKGTRKIQCSASTTIGDAASKLYPSMDESFGIRAMLLFAILPSNSDALSAFAAQGPYATTGEKWVDPAIEAKAKQKAKMDKITEGLSPEQLAALDVAIKAAEQAKEDQRQATIKAEKAMRDAMEAITKMRAPAPVVAGPQTTIPDAAPGTIPANTSPPTQATDMSKSTAAPAPAAKLGAKKGK